MTNHDEPTPDVEASVTAWLRGAPPPELPSEVAARLDAQLALLVAQMPAPVVPLRRRPRRWVPALAAAAMLAVAGVALTRVLPPATVDPAADAGSQSAGFDSESAADAGQSPQSSLDSGAGSQTPPTEAAPRASSPGPAPGRSQLSKARTAQGVAAQCETARSAPSPGFGGGTAAEVARLIVVSDQRALVRTRSTYECGANGATLIAWSIIG